MSAKNLDKHDRFRCITVGFRVSPEEHETINRIVALSGLTKQEYCYRKCTDREIVVEGNPRVYKALKVELAAVLDEQLQGFVTEHPDTKLIIIDTLQKVREVGGDNYSYANDYEIINRIKKFTDRYGICVLIVHHTRKQNADDKFDMISGTTALLGCCPQTTGQRPITPSESAMAPFDRRRLSKVLFRYF